MIFTFGCQHRPPATKVYESHRYVNKVLISKLAKKLVVDEDTIIIDARRGFDYTLAHIKGSYNIHWSHFARQNGPQRGVLYSDLYKVSRWLARKGIGLNSKIIVVDDGRRSNGLAGRLAWTLLYLGIKDVQVSSIDHLKMKLTQSKSPKKEKLTLWKPKLQDSIIVKDKEFEDSIKYKTPYRVIFIDVRTHQEFFAKGEDGLKYKTPNIGAILIPWDKFYDKKGRPNLFMVDRLGGIGIRPSDRIIVLSNYGIKAAAAVTSLLTLGYSNVGAYTGSLKQFFEQQ